MGKLDNAWFEADRATYKGDELRDQKEQTEKALRASNLIVDRLRSIIQKDIDKTYLVEEAFDNPAWERMTIAAAAERKVLRRYLKLLP